MRTLPESACPTLEEHLLICQSCRDRLQATDRYVVTMRRAANVLAVTAGRETIGGGQPRKHFQLFAGNFKGRGIDGFSPFGNHGMPAALVGTLLPSQGTR